MPPEPSAAAAPRPAPATPRLPLRRPVPGRVLGGVARGLSVHLAMPVSTVRVGFVALSLVAGAGVLLYVFLLVTVPTGDPADAAAAGRPAVLSRLAPRSREDWTTVPWTEIGLGLGALLAAVVLIVGRFSPSEELTWVVPVVIVAAGLVLAWSQLDHTPGGASTARRSAASYLRLGAGLLLSVAGVLLLVTQHEDVGAVLTASLAALAVLAGVAVVLAPWWLRLVRELNEERQARVREAERADIAAHLHDSVLQTLALIRKSAGDADQVARLARAQERELRGWLYEDRSEPGTSLAAELAGVVAEVEDAYAVAVDPVVVGDTVPDESTHALLRATREALLNAARHGSPPISLYVEVGPGAVEVFVRDRGPGFDVDAVPEDRLGVRESILGRVRRRGGSAEILSRPGQGAEVRLRMPIGVHATSAPSAATPEGRADHDRPDPDPHDGSGATTPKGTPHD